MHPAVGIEVTRSRGRCSPQGSGIRCSGRGGGESMHNTYHPPAVPLIPSPSSSSVARSEAMLILVMSSKTRIMEHVKTRNRDRTVVSKRGNDTGMGTSGPYTYLLPSVWHSCMETKGHYISNSKKCPFVYLPMLYR